MYKGSTNPIGLYTIDIKTKDCKETVDQMLHKTIKEKKIFEEGERKKLWENKFKR